MSYKLIGYHGTTQNNSKLILKDQKFTKSKNTNSYKHWLGEGVYFFENDEKQAYDFIVKAKKCDNVSVLKADIIYDTIFDLTLTKDRDVFEELSKQLKDKFELARKNNPKIQFIDYLIVDYLFEIEPFDIVRADYTIPKTGYFENSLLRPIQRQICVKNDKCIKNIVEVNIDGYM